MSKRRKKQLFKILATLFLIGAGVLGSVAIWISHMPPDHLTLAGKYGAQAVIVGVYGIVFAMIGWD